MKRNGWRRFSFISRNFLFFSARIRLLKDDFTEAEIIVSHLDFGKLFFSEQNRSKEKTVPPKNLNQLSRLDVWAIDTMCSILYRFVQ